MSFKKRILSNKNARTKVSGDSDEEDITTVVRSSDHSKSSSLELHSSSSLKKTNETGQVDKLGSAVTTVFESSRELVPQSYAGNATHTTEVDPALSRKVVKTFGPVRAPTFVRVTSRFDYQPDICKDYKETGFCGFGDSCKFLHDRGDYKSGWQLEREWETKQLSKKKKLEDSIAAFDDDATERKVDDDEDDDDNKYAIDSDEEDLPFACFVCREDFVNPIVTVCGHYFCSHCAIEGMKSTSNKCPICNKQTFGVFNRAHKLLKQIALKKGVVDSNADDPSAASTAAVINVPVKRRGNWETVDT